MEPRKVPRPTCFPRPSQRDPSPSYIPRSMPESQPIVMSDSRFGIGRPTRKNTSKGESSAPVAQELRSKSSHNVRRRPSPIPAYSGSRAPTVSSSTSSLPTGQPQKSSEYTSAAVSLKPEEVFGGRPTPAAVTPSPIVYPKLDQYGARPQVSDTMGTRYIPELLHKLSTQNLPPLTSLFSGDPSTLAMSGGHNHYSRGYSAGRYSANPSIRFSECPGFRDPYSKNTTPTSISSQSPSIMALAKPATPTLPKGSPTQSRPLITRRTETISNETKVRRPLIDSQGQSSLWESLTSSSSNFTVKCSDRGEEDTKAKKKQKRLSSLPPSPPPRKSSLNFNKSLKVKKSPSQSPQAPVRTGMMPPSDESLTRQRIGRPHALATSGPPFRPTRGGAPDLQEQLTEPAAVIQSNVTGINVSQEKRRNLLPKSTVFSPPPQSTASRSQEPSCVPLKAPSPLPVQQQKIIIKINMSGNPLPSSFDVNRSLNSQPTDLGIAPNLRPLQVQPSSSRSPALRTPGPSILGTRPRFSQFGRAKTTSEVPQMQNKGKPVVGKYATRGGSNYTGRLGWNRDRNLSGASSSADKLPMVSPKEKGSLKTPVIFTSPETMTPDFSQAELNLSKETATVRPSRLPQVGRIPKVISARPAAASPKSFSRPFARLSTIQPLLEPMKLDEQFIAFGFNSPNPSVPEPDALAEDAQTAIDSKTTHIRHTSGDSKSENTGGRHHKFFIVRRAMIRLGKSLRLVKRT
ncbi:hypothetical protein F5884DRAFT_544733 [Xylogone sp. PMI_703]|nr:hypothetical protein F5884DRAFT_544733 [Xylogone sp. PMI_703]